MIKIKKSLRLVSSLRDSGLAPKDGLHIDDQIAEFGHNMSIIKTGYRHGQKHVIYVCNGTIKMAIKQSNRLTVTMFSEDTPWIRGYFTRLLN